MSVVRKGGWRETYGGLEDAFVAPVCGCGFLYFVFARVRVHDAVLAGDLLLVPLPVGPLFLLILLESILELVLQAADLAVLGHGAA